MILGNILCWCILDISWEVLSSSRQVIISHCTSCPFKKLGRMTINSSQISGEWVPWNMTYKNKIKHQPPPSIPGHQPGIAYIVRRPSDQIENSVTPYIISYQVPHRYSKVPHGRDLCWIPQGNPKIPSGRDLCWIPPREPQDTLW